MTKRELIEKIASKKEEMRSILEKAKKDGRKELNPDEKRSFESIEQECTMLNYQFRMENQEVFSFGKAPESVQKRFAEAMADYMSDGRPVELSLRSINAEAVVHDASTPIIYEDLQKPLEKGFVLDRLGVKILYNVHGEPMWPFVDGAEASVLGENDEVGDTQLTFETVKSTPKRISMNYAVSNRAINQSNLNLYGLVMEGLGMGVARKLNHIICDTAAHGQYKSPFVGLTDMKIKHKTKGKYTLKDIVDVEHLVLDKMVDAMSGNSAYIINTKMAAILKTTPVMDGQLAMLLNMHYDPATNTRWGDMNGYNVLFSNYVADDTILFGDFRYLGIPQFGDISIIFDPYSLKKKNAVEFTLNTEMDMVTIRKEAFSMSKHEL